MAIAISRMAPNLFDHRYIRLLLADSIRIPPRPLSVAELTVRDTAVDFAAGQRIVPQLEHSGPIAREKVAKLTVSSIKKC